MSWMTPPARWRTPPIPGPGGNEKGKPRAAHLALIAAMSLGAARVGDLSVSGGWIRSLPGATPAAAYFVLHNNTATPRVLVGASSPACASLMIHQSHDVGGVETMSAVPRLPVPAHGEVRFSPGGYHLMCMSPTKLARPGAFAPVTLRFAGGASLTARFAVRGPLG